jgi:8-oxo-dGTP pyrophosphatase MutT (NUDIX family)
MATIQIVLKTRLILYNRGSILLLRQTKPNGGNYTLVGGNIERFEYAKGCLIREAEEEAGITLREKDLQLVHVLQKNTPTEQRFVFYFKAYRWEGKLKAKEKNKFTDAEWFHLDELPRNLTATVRHVLEEYRKGNLYSEIKKTPPVLPR